MKISHLILIVFFFCACSENDPLPPVPVMAPVVVLNEGNFLAGNGSIDVYDAEVAEVDNSVYSAQATIQNLQEHQGSYYLVSNAPDRVDVLDTDLLQTNRIDEGFDNPIDFAAIGNRGYVTNWGDIATAFSENPDSYVAIVDLDNHIIIDSVLLEVRPQGIIAHEGKLIIANEGGSSVTILDPADLSLQQVELVAGPSNLKVDGEGDIWVLCTSGWLYELDGSDYSVQTDIDGLITSGFNEKMDINSSTNTLYFLGGNNDSFTGSTTVYEVDLNNETVVPLIEDGFALYGIGVRPANGDLYVGDSNAFQSTGTAFVYDALGQLQDQFATGIGPNGFYFVQ